MASHKILLYKSKTFGDGSHPVMLRVIIDRRPVYYTLGDKNFKALISQWDEVEHNFNSNKPDYDILNRNLSAIIADITDVWYDLKKKDPNFSHADFKRKYEKKTKTLYLLKYIDELVKRMESTGMVGNAIVYKTMKNAFQRFIGKEIEMKSIDKKKLNLFIESLQTKGLKPNSINNYLRTLRAVYNTAIEEEDFEYYPFKNFNWKNLSSVTEKRAISKADLKRFVNYECEKCSELDKVRQIFAFQYLNSGVSFADIVKLEKSNIYEIAGQYILSYRRKKVGSLIQLPLNDISLNIIIYFQKFTSNSKYVFPFLDDDIQITEKQKMTRRQTALKKYNDGLRKIAKALEFDRHMTSYVSRHTFASVLINEGADIFEVKEMMGHKDIKTTLIYTQNMNLKSKRKAGEKLIS